MNEKQVDRLKTPEEIGRLAQKLNVRDQAHMYNMISAILFVQSAEEMRRKKELQGHQRTGGKEERCRM